MHIHIYVSMHTLTMCMNMHTNRLPTSVKMQHTCSVNMVIAGGGNNVSVKVCMYVCM